MCPRDVLTWHAHMLQQAAVAAGAPAPPAPRTLHSTRIPSACAAEPATHPEQRLKALRS